MPEKNNSIKCSVTECQYNLGSDHYCTLDSIMVASCQRNPNTPDHTECNSFVKRS